jgi:hypothetical protein
MGSSLAHQLSQVEITPTQCVMADGLITAWEPVERVHSLKHINKVYTDSLAIEEGENHYNFDDEYYQNRHTFTAA